MSCIEDILKIILGKLWFSLIPWSVITDNDNFKGTLLLFSVVVIKYQTSIIAVEVVMAGKRFVFQ